jgi:hypothetical protein
MAVTEYQEVRFVASCAEYPFSNRALTRYQRVYKLLQHPMRRFPKLCLHLHELLVEPAVEILLLQKSLAIESSVLMV